MDIETPDCVLCGGDSYRPLFSKSSPRGGEFTLVACKRCGLRFLSPRPTEESIKAFYEPAYFTSRSDRGYDNYCSEAIKTEITRVLALNLADLGYFSFEKTLVEDRRYLDIGCAAGYSVLFMKQREWDAAGIDIAGECIRFGREDLGLELTLGNYLKTRYDNPFQLISLWATIEHLHRPDLIMRKIREDLCADGMVYISTCRTGGFMKYFGTRWRYFNFPEHLYYFSFRQLKKLLEKTGFTVERHAFYGSGIGKAGTFKRKIADWAAKWLGLGDMMIVAARKNSPSVR